MDRCDSDGDVGTGDIRGDASVDVKCDAGVEGHANGGCDAHVDVSEAVDGVKVPSTTVAVPVVTSRCVAATPLYTPQPRDTPAVVARGAMVSLLPHIAAGAAEGDTLARTLGAAASLAADTKAVVAACLADVLAHGRAVSRCVYHCTCGVVRVP